MTIEDLKFEIRENIEFATYLEGYVMECITIENLEGILSRFFNEKIKLSLE